MRLGPLVLTCIAMAGACGGSPTSPATGSLPLQAGVFTLSIWGPDYIAVGRGPTRVGCPDISGSGTGSRLVVDLNVGEERGIWRGLPVTAEGGSFELQVWRGAGPTISPSEGSPTQFDSIPVEGMIRGTAINTLTLPGQIARRPQISFSACATGSDGRFDGEVLYNGALPGGYFSGPVIFTDGADASVRCNPGTVFWSLSRQSPVN